MKKWIALLGLTCTMLVSLNTATAQEQNFKSNKLGWEISMPEDWPRVTPEEQEEIRQAGEMEFDENGVKTATKEVLREMIGYKKDDYNNLFITVEQFPAEYKGKEKEYYAYMLKELNTTLTQAGLEVKSDETDQAVADKKFHKIHTQIFAGGNEVLQQEIYSRVEKDLVWSAVMTYNNDDDLALMKAAFIESIKSQK